ncbi:hypothetical protein KVV02_006410 [Mortierella alpina]|uniref:Uncharacterized protein n=1 Tax=Mortierella alpina TaxID=64518 RepID=A0A9P8IF61_MORAP|nr:hypothetical protein KVV02_006410 [Mortierella alpina]
MHHLHIFLWAILACMAILPRSVLSIQPMAQLEGGRDPSNPSISLVPAAGSGEPTVAQASSSQTYLIVGMAITMGVVAVVVSLFVLRRKSKLLGGSSVPTFEIQSKGPVGDDGESGNSGYGQEKNLSAFQPEMKLLEKPEKAHPRNSGMNHSRNSAYIDYFQDEYDQVERRRLSYLMDAHTADLDDASVHSAEQQLLSPSPSPSPKPSSRLHQAVMSASYKLRNPRRQSRLYVDDPLQDYEKKKRGSMLIRDDNRTASMISRSNSAFVRPPKSTRRKTFSKPIHIRAHHHAVAPQQQSVRTSDGSGAGYQSRGPYGYM